VEHRTVGSIDRGFLVLVGVSVDDDEAAADALAAKIAGLRIFDDADGAMNLALGDVGGAALIVSQFTLLGDARKGRRPSFIAAARGDRARELYERVVRRVAESGIEVATGIFGADMQVELINDGPVTILIDTTRLF
jgi:D-tyrosyl-tRNA(Tyr) deacylase